jgi:hypothetical protein
MSVIGSNILAGASGQGGGYNLTNSLRFRSSASAYLNRTFSTPTDNKKFTWSGWVKRGTLGAFQVLQCGDDGTSDNFLSLRFSDTDTLQCFQIGGGSYNLQVSTSAVFRDPSAWYHIVFIYDSANATSTNRIQFYVNGVLQAVSYAVGPFAINTASQLNVASRPNAIGRLLYASVQYFDGYLDEVNFIDGQALTPSSFGETSTSTGVWIPKKYTGTYGTNGFYLPFTDNSALTTSSNVGLGKDFSGNSNYWTTNNISITSGSTYDSMTDVPTLTSATASNYCVLNPIFNVNGTNVTYSNGNLTFSHPANSGNAQLMAIRGTIALAAGKYYWEYTVGATVNDQVGIGNNVALGGSADGTAGARYLNSGAFQSNYTNPSSAASYTTNDIIGVAYDQPNGTLAFYKNNSLQGTITNISTTEVFFPSRSPSSSGTGGAGSFNFGQQPFAYTPPTGFNRLNTFNLPTPTIGATASTTANKYMDATTYTGNGGTQSITSLGFQPDLVWVKRRNAVASHNLVDAVRGASKILYSDATTAEITDTNDINAFNSNGWTMGLNTDVNASGGTYVGWTWRGANGTVTNTAGSITSTVSANTSAGFSIVTYTGTGSTGTIGHGLGVAPSMMIVKRRNGAANWFAYHSALGATQYIYLDATAAAITASGAWNNTAPTSTVFSVGNFGEVNLNTGTYVAYCFAPVAGYSAFSSFTGNGSTDGAFVYTGFRPAFVMLKASSTGGAGYNWGMFDNDRLGYNSAQRDLRANLIDAEGGDNDLIDFISNGFKIRSTSGGFGGGSGVTYIYMAFAETPQKFALGR